MNPTRLRFLTAGESHGPMLTGILEGMPAGIPLNPKTVNTALARRQKGYGSGGRMQIERDQVRFTGGVMAGKTTGGPISLLIRNRDWKNWATKDVDPFTTPRPGHADLTGALKYDYDDLRLALERASARETAARVAIGAICQQLLTAFDITIGGYVTRIGLIDAALPAAMDYPARFAAAEENEVRCPDSAAAAQMQAAIRQAKIDKDTLGGIFEIVALGLPPGLGSHVHYDRRLTGRLLGAMGSIQSIKGAEIGPAFDNTTRPGTQVHDAITRDGDTLHRATNRAGGLEGGMTTGAPLIVRAAMKPISTTLSPLATVDLATGESSQTVYERSDFCAVPRAVVVGEAMVAFVLADALLEKLGGDHLAELQTRFAALKQGKLSDLSMHNTAWQLGYDWPTDIEF
jgi:chorismate synthase